MIYIDSTVKAVRIYRRGVEITREGFADLSAGKNRIGIRGICPEADPSSLRLFFPAGVMGSNIRLVPRNEAEKEEEKPSEAIREKIERIEGEITILEEQTKLWKENGDFKNRQSAGIAEMEAYIEKFPARIAAAAEKHTALTKEKKRLEKELNEVLAEERKMCVLAELDAKAGGRCRFETVYYARCAAWDPVYEIHSDGKGDAIELRFRAEVSQNTGEDWKDAETVLCSGNPSASGDLPELKPQYLNIRPEAPLRAAGMRAVMSEAAMPMMMAKSAPMGNAATDVLDIAAPMERIETPQAEVVEGETMTEYSLGKREIPSGGDSTAMDLKKYAVPAKLRLLAVPKLDDRAYLAAEIRAADLPHLMAGKAAVYLAGAYMGDIRLSAEGTEETLRISLGKEEKIQVQRKEVRKKTAAALLKNQKTTEYGYEILISNKKNETVRVFVTDQVPVSQDKTIVVDGLDADKGTVEEETGKITWKVEVPPQKTETRRLAYRIGWPKDKEIQMSRQTWTFLRFCPQCGAEVSGKFCPVCGSIVNG